MTAATMRVKARRARLETMFGHQYGVIYRDSLTGDRVHFIPATVALPPVPPPRP